MKEGVKVSKFDLKLEKNLTRHKTTFRNESVDPVNKEH